ncbi:minor capsid protein [Alkaliphilus sp. MSJ-5]|uniref:Minor capsid protein n=1 Tax=Alkaliphilus flagellatus TaxID=2841507 RepID=A0ABS6G5Z1_9FIRM|nr:minor capsid protein [Alkaliphilus flagellatus]MBU5677900.1 minor capsid protein [Alkaliphilus flagellatus]
MKSNQYWKQRSIERMAKYHKDSEETINLISNAYSKALHDIEEDIRKIVGTYATNGKLTSAQARKYLNQKIPNFILDIIRNLYPKVKNESLQQWMLSILNAPAYKARITRLEALKQSIYLRTKLVADIETQLATSQYLDTINPAYYRNMFDIQKGISMGFDVAQMPTNVIKTVLNNPWSGKHFSSRIWNNTDALAEKLIEVITSGFMSGKSIDRMVKEIEELTDYGKFAATRLVRTETTFMANAAEMESYKEAGIDKYIYVATLDMRTSDICQKLDRQIFNVKDAEPGKNLPPMHPYCRSTTRAYLGEDTLKGIQRRARDPKTGKTYLVPADMSYKEWYKKYVVDEYGQDQAQAMKNKIVNKSSDKEQHNRYKDILGKEVPKSFDKFQELKYNNSEEWKGLQQLYRDTNSGKVWQNAEFSTEKLFNKHYDKHLSEYGNITKEEYLNMARDLLASPVKGDIEGFKSGIGFVFRYNKTTNDFAIGRADGYISTLYKPIDGYEHYLEQVEKYMEE